MSLRNLKLGTKQILGFGLILTIMAIVNLFSIDKMGILKTEINEVSTNWMPRAVALSDIKGNTLDLRINQLQHALVVDEATKQAQADNMIALIDKMNDNLDTYDSLKTESEERNLYSEREGRLYDQFDRRWEEYQDLSFIFFMLIRDNRNQEAIDLLNGKALEVFKKAGTILEELVKVNKEDALEAAQRAEKTFSSTRHVTHLLLIATIFLSILIAGGLVRFITVPVQQLEKAAKRVAEGDLDVRLEICSMDEIGHLSNSFNQMSSSLCQATSKMKRQADELLVKHEELQTTYKELEEKSQTLEKQKTEIEQKNNELQQAMDELKTTQEQLLMKEKMAALGDLVAGVTHELNNPIGAVNSTTDVSGRCINKIEIVLEQCKTLEEIKSNPDLPKALEILKDNIKITLTAGNRIATIVKSLKNFARLDESAYQRVDIHEGIDSSLTLLESEFKNRISLAKEYGPIPKIGCYPGQLNQVFLSLLKNAVQAIENTGLIEIKTFADQKRVHVQISDTGKGIPGDKLDRIFDFGFSADGSRVKMGAGLSSVFNIIQKHNGDIKVDSEPGKGTRFTILLPVN